MLEVRGLAKSYGGLAALSELSLDVEEGEIRGVIGPNGAGKTTLFNVISGVEQPTQGTIHYLGEEISGLPASAVTKRGLVRTFQRTAVFGGFTVLENVSVARHLHAKESIFGAIFGTALRMEKENEERALEILEFIGLAKMKDVISLNLAHGHQKALGIAIALATEPKCLMLDEPVAGMNFTETKHMTELIRKIRDKWGVTILLVEHDMKTVMGVCEKITVLNFGEKLAEGLPEEIRASKDVIEAYLGAEEIVS